MNRGLRHGPAPGPTQSDFQELDFDIKRVAEALKVPSVARDDQIPTRCGANHNRRINQIRRSRRTAGRSGRTGPHLVQFFDPTARQQSRHLCLWSATPSLPQNTGRDDRHVPTFQQATMQRPNSSIAALACDQRSRIIGSAHGLADTPLGLGASAGIEHCVSPRQLFGGQRTMLRFPRSHRRQASFNHQCPLRCRVDPRRQTHAV